MRPRYLSAAAIAVGLTLLGAPARAQPPGGAPAGPRSPAPFSPYLNLVRQGATPAVNYYGIVRPQTQFANSIQDLQRQSTAVGPSGGSDASDQSLVTGHAFGFQNQYLYFQNQYSGSNFGGSRSGGNAGLGVGRYLPGSGNTTLVTSPQNRR